MNSKTKAMHKACEVLEKNALPECEWDCVFHLAPKTGWMNDPNGLCQMNGVYHIFFQYSPFDTKPGTNYWGHYTTKDFINYEYLKPALCVDEKFDCHGVYSGSAVAEDGVITLFYTGNVKQCGDYDYITAGREHNTISLTSQDGVNFSDKALLMTNSDYPADCTCHVRDPKVWKENGVYYMLLGSRRTDDVGEVLVMSSPDKKSWSLCSRITTPEKFGFMWECPDMFTLGGKRFLAVSPQGVEADGYRYNNIYQSGYFEIDGDFTGKCTPVNFTEYDCGFDFYAPQSFVDEKGRRILIGWFGLPDIDGLYSNPTAEKCGRVHVLTAARELTVNEKGRLCQFPIEEYRQLRLGSNTVKCEGEINISDLTVFDMDIQVNGADSFSAVIREDCIIAYNDGVFTLSFGKAGCGRTRRCAETGSIDSLYIMCDASSVEIYLNGGEYVFSSRFYPEKSQSGVRISGIDGEVRYSKLRGFSIADV